ncbi:class I SAM-dependent methyltransferase [Silvimonas iriomotensis]|uniref:Methyltransferase type 11 domain-containing protein n=1 Tax=Silvimonas iriomotensis TaxID=449662 RepID=A0ABQ2PBD6_9NEIS|nr:class I SAM-dependent methyltransferase [Silvimonas iriomotensis]GGP22721.1 hypothetical protein GCM10010970_27210 [Silvimonas iriomotensis]
MTSLTLDTPALAQQYDEISDPQYEHGQFLLQALSLKAGDQLLDIGAGTGRLSELAARHHVGPHGQVTALEPLPLRVEIARKRASANHTAEVGQGEDLSRYADGQFDAVILNSVYHWLPDKARVLAEAFRVLKPGGRIGISSAARERPHDIQQIISRALGQNGLGRGHAIGSTPYKVSFAELAKQLEHAGFLVDEIRIRRFADRFPNTQAALDFSAASSFGNFLNEFLPDVRSSLLADIHHALAQYRQADGSLLLYRNLLFAVGKKPNA